jgi:glycosyltransferase involved in cell wall biosynthesis
MSFVIFGDSFTFPEGNAATNRVHTYAKGFLENGIKVHVICFADEYNTLGDNITNGIYYYHPFKQKRRSKYFIVRRWQELIKYFKTAKLIKKINGSDKIIAVNCWTLLLSTHLFAFFLAKYIRTEIISEHSEHPLRNYQGSVFKKIQGKIKSYLEAMLCDGIFCISQYLIEFYKIRGVRPKKLFLVPSTVDTERFRTFYSSPLPFQYILYCGALTLIKDGVDILIKSFVRISEKHPQINLVLIGKGETENTELLLKDLVNSLNINNRVIFLGQLSRADVPAYLTNAKILALARPRSIVADAGFPSKLTEYLASGIPVVVTEVGEIPIYLTDKENAFLAKPDSVDAFADKLEFVLNNYKFAEDVATKGQELTNTVFNYNYQAKRMLNYINLISLNAK